MIKIGVLISLIIFLLLSLLIGILIVNYQHNKKVSGSGFINASECIVCGTRFKAADKNFYNPNKFVELLGQVSIHFGEYPVTKSFIVQSKDFVCNEAEELPITNINGNIISVKKGRIIYSQDMTNEGLRINDTIKIQAINGKYYKSIISTARYYVKIGALSGTFYNKIHDKKFNEYNAKNSMLIKHVFNVITSQNDWYYENTSTDVLNAEAKERGLIKGKNGLKANDNVGRKIVIITKAKLAEFLECLTHVYLLYFIMKNYLIDIDCIGISEDDNNKIIQIINESPYVDFNDWYSKHGTQCFPYLLDNNEIWILKPRDINDNDMLVVCTNIAREFEKIAKFYEIKGNYTYTMNILRSRWLLYSPTNYLPIIIEEINKSEEFTKNFKLPKRPLIIRNNKRKRSESEKYDEKEKIKINEYNKSVEDANNFIQKIKNEILSKDDINYNTPMYQPFNKNTQEDFIIRLTEEDSSEFLSSDDDLDSSSPN